MKGWQGEVGTEVFSFEEVLSEQDDLKPLSIEDTLSQGGRSSTISVGGGGSGSFGSLCIVGGGTYGGGGGGERF